jgi:hypothetical protein
MSKFLLALTVCLCQIVHFNAHAQSPFSKALAFDSTLRKFKAFDEKFCFTIDDTVPNDGIQKVLFVYRLNNVTSIKLYVCSDSLLLEYPLFASDSKKVNRRSKIYFHQLFKYQVGIYDSKHVEKAPDKHYFDAIPKAQIWVVRAERKPKPQRNNFVFVGNISIYKYNIQRKYVLKFTKDLRRFTQLITVYVEEKYPGKKLSM